MARTFKGGPAQIDRLLGAVAKRAQQLRTAGFDVEVKWRLIVGFDLDTTSSGSLGAKLQLPGLNDMIRQALESAGAAEGGWQRIRHLLGDGELTIDINASAKHLRAAQVALSERSQSPPT